MEKEDEKQKEKQNKSWRDIVGARNPDLDLDDEEAVAAWMEASFAEADKVNSEREQLNNLLISDPHAAGILTGLSSGMNDKGEPFSLTAYLLDNYWEDIQEAESKEEAVERARKREAEQLEKAAEEEKRSKQSADNLKASDDALTEAVEKSNVDEANVVAMLSWLYGEKEKDNGFVYRIIRNEINADDWQKLLFAFNREHDLEQAGQEGARRAASRSGKPHRSFRQEGVPSDLGGGGGVSSEGVDDPTVNRYKGMKRRFS